MSWLRPAAADPGPDPLRWWAGPGDEDDDETPIGDPDVDDEGDDEEDDDDDEGDTMWAASAFAGIG